MFVGGTPAAWALSLAQAVTCTSSSRSKLVTATNKPPPACLERRVAERWGKEQTKEKDTNLGHRFGFEPFPPRLMEAPQGQGIREQR